jgi:hypothetical protein
MVAPLVYAVGTIASGTGGISPALPAGTTKDDVLLLVMETGNEAVAAMTGWSDVTGSPVQMATAQATRLTVRWKRAAPGEVAPSVPDPGDHVIGRIVGVRGCKTTGDPWNTANTGTEATSDTSASFPTVTTTAAECLVVNLIALGTDILGTTRFTGWTNASLSSITENVDNSTDLGNGGGIGVASGIKATAGAVSATTMTVAAAGTKAMMTIAFEPYLAGAGQTFLDQFTALSINWDNWGSGLIIGGRFQLTSGTLAFDYFGAQWIPSITITGQSVGSTLIDDGNQSLLGYGVYPVSIVFSANNEAYWIITGGTAFCYTNVGGVFTQRGSGVTHVDGRRYYVGEYSGNIVWHWSDDGVTWTSQTSLANPWAGDTSINAYLMVGTDQANGGTTTAIFEDSSTWVIPGGTTPVSNSLSMLWNVASTVSSGLDTRWHVRQEVASGLDTRWHVRAVASNDLDMRWHVRSSVPASDLDTRWHVRALVSQALETQWRSLVQIGNSLDTRWNVRAIVAGALDTRWHVRATTASSLDTRWHVRSSVSASALSTLWHVRAAIASGLDTRWNVRASVGSQLNTLWHVRATVGQDLDTRWVVRQLVASALETIWNVEGDNPLTPVSSSLEMLWNVRALVTSPLDTRWVVRNQIGNSLDTRWNVRAIANASLDTRWNVRAGVAQSLDMRWHVRASVSQALDTRWVVRQLVTSALEARWHVRAQSAQTLSTLWHVRQVVQGTLDTRWHVYVGVSAELATFWVVRQRVVSPLVTLWHVESLTPPTPLPADVEAILDVVVGGRVVEYAVDYRAGYVINASLSDN